MSYMPASSALSGLRVVDFSRVRAGPNCVRILADFGADVVRVEPPPGVDPNDTMFAHRRDGGDFQNTNRNKRSMTLDLKSEGARPILHRLLSQADVVVENWRPDVKARLGLDYDTLSALNPRIILASISAYGESGPYAERPGFDQVIQGMGGLMSITGEPGRGPMRVGIAVADMGAGLYAAIGVLVALAERERSGRGQWVQTSLLRSQIALLDFQAARYLNEGDVPESTGNDHPTSCPMGLFRASDGHFNLGAAGEGNWRRLCNVLQHPEWAQQPEFSTASGRVERRQQVNAMLQEVFDTRPVQHWVEALNAAGVPAGPVYSIPQMFDDVQVRHLAVTSTLPTGAGPRAYLRQPVDLSRTQHSVVRPAPACGEHSAEILGELGFGPAEIDALRAGKVI